MTSSDTCLCRVGLDHITVFQLYDDTFRLHRKWMHTFMGTRAAVRRFENLEMVETRRLLLRILNEPEKFMDHLRTLVLHHYLRLNCGRMN